MIRYAKNVTESFWINFSCLKASLNCRTFWINKSCRTAKAVAMKETKEQAAIKREMLERLSVILAHCTAQRIARRSTLANRRLCEPAVYRAAAAAAHLDVDWGDWQ